MGFAEKNHRVNRHLGWEPRSCGFSASTGECYVNGFRVEATLPATSTGDLIGCGLFGEDLFFTKNGRRIGEFFRGVGGTVGLHPAVCSSDGAILVVNRGEVCDGTRFRCDLEVAVKGSGNRKAGPLDGSTGQLGMELVSSGRKWLKVLRDGLTVKASGKPSPKGEVYSLGSMAPT